MKIRIQGDTIRLRLSQTEIDRLSQTGEIKEATHFGSDVFAYSISLIDQLTEPTASYRGGKIAVQVPQEMGTEWIESDQVGIENKAYTNQSDGLKILIEKDFQCLHKRRNEDESDAFPNPLAKK